MYSRGYRLTKRSKRKGLKSKQWSDCLKNNSHSHCRVITVEFSLVHPRYRLDKHLLHHFAEHPGTSAYDITPVKKMKRHNDNEYRKRKYSAQRLRKMQPTEDVPKTNNIHKAKCSKLSRKGIYYLIANNSALPYGILKSLLKNYGDHSLFLFCNIFSYVLIFT